jgi:Tol biopolymer transport system component
MYWISGTHAAGRRVARGVAVFAVCLSVALATQESALAITFGALPVAGAPGLPDARGYEMISPLDKNQAGVSEAAISSTGDRVVFTSTGSFAGSPSAPVKAAYLAIRGGSGWSTQGISAPLAPVAGINSGGAYIAYSTDLRSGIFVAGEPALVPGAPPRGTSGNTYVRDLSGGTYQLLTQDPVNPPDSSEAFSSVAVGSRDFSHIAFDYNASITGDAPTGAPQNAYEWSAGTTHFVGILPDGSKATEGSDIGGGIFGSLTHAISEDGSKVFFSAPVTNGGIPQGSLYVRENGTTTIRVSASQRTPSDPSGPQVAVFSGATSDGSKVFFTDREKLTGDATANVANALGDLYEYDLNTGLLTDLSVDTNDSQGANLLGVAGISDDGSYVYFVATGQILGGEGTAGQPNLYLSHNGVITYITTLDGDPSSRDEFVWRGGSVNGSRITPDGRHLVFGSDLKLTSYPNEGHSEVYIYDADSNQLGCVSCAPSGAPAVSDARLSGGTLNPDAQTHNLSADGSRVFFETAEGLVPRDTNGRTDVYEWEGGQVGLISSGQDNSDSQFADASATGDDVLFTTSEQLVPEDQDALIDLYDARVDGGPPQNLSAPVCTGTGCQGLPAPQPLFATPASSTFNGVGNFAPQHRAAAVKPRAKPLTRAQKLRKALASCHRRARKRRAACESLAKRKYGGKPAVKTTSKTKSMRSAGR